MTGNDWESGKFPVGERPCGVRRTAVLRAANGRAACGEGPCRVRRTAVLRAANGRAAYGELPYCEWRTAVPRTATGREETGRAAIGVNFVGRGLVSEALTDHRRSLYAVTQPQPVPISRRTPSGCSPYAARPVAARGRPRVRLPNDNPYRCQEN